MARALLEKGHRVTMVCGGYEGGQTGLTGPFRRSVRRGTVDGIDVVEIFVPYSNKMSFPRRIVQFAKFAFIASRLAVGERYDLLFATSTPLTIAIPAMVGRLLRRKPMVFEVRDLWPELPKAMGVITNPLLLGLMSMLEWCAYRASDHVIGLSPGMVEGVRRRGVAAARISMIPNGCDLDLFDPRPMPRQAGTFPAEVAPDDFVAVFCGAHGLANGLEAAVEAAAELDRRGVRSIKLVLVGDGKTKPALQEEARRRGLGNILFMDPMPKLALVDLLRQADLGLMLLKNVEAFYYGTSPNKFFDYLAAGKPVLVNHPGWVAQIVTDNDIGYAVAPDDAAAFADALMAAAAAADLKEKGKRARLVGETEFSRQRLGEAFVAVIEKAAR